VVYHSLSTFLAIVIPKISTFNFVAEETHLAGSNRHVVRLAALALRCFPIAWDTHLQLRTFE